MEELLIEATASLADAGAWVYLAGPGLMAVVAVLPIPAEAPAMLNGVLFGPVLGTVFTWTGAVAGAVVSFEASRAWGRPLLRRLVGPSTLAAADEVAREASWQGMLAARLIPVVAFTALNWGAGMASVPRWRFLWTTALGILPGAIVFTAAGTGAAELLGGALPLLSAAAVVFLLLRFFLGRRGRRRARKGAAGSPPADASSPTTPKPPL